MLLLAVAGVTSTHGAKQMTSVTQPLHFLLTSTKVHLVPRCLLDSLFSVWKSRSLNASSIHIREETPLQTVEKEISAAERDAHTIESLRPRSSWYKT